MGTTGSRDECAAVGLSAITALISSAAPRTATRRTAMIEDLLMQGRFLFTLDFDAVA